MLFYLANLLTICYLCCFTSCLNSLISSALTKLSKTLSPNCNNKTIDLNAWWALMFQQFLRGAPPPSSPWIRGHFFELFLFQVVGIKDRVRIEPNPSCPSWKFLFFYLKDSWLSSLWSEFLFLSIKILSSNLSSCLMPQLQGSRFILKLTLIHFL